MAKSHHKMLVCALKFDEFVVASDRGKPKQAKGTRMVLVIWSHQDYMYPVMNAVESSVDCSE